MKFIEILSFFKIPFNRDGIMDLIIGGKWEFIIEWIFKCLILIKLISFGIDGKMTGLGVIFIEWFIRLLILRFIKNVW